MIRDDEVPAIAAKARKAMTLKLESAGRFHEQGIDADPVFAGRHEGARYCPPNHRYRKQQLDDCQKQYRYEPDYSVKREDGEIGGPTKMTNKCFHAALGIVRMLYFSLIRDTVSR